MNIDIVGRIRPPVAGEIAGGVIAEGNRVMAQRGGMGHNFNILFQQDSPNSEIFSKTVQPLLDLFIAGFNTCVLIYGESGAGKSFTMTGEQTGNSEPGIVPQAIGYVTNHIQKQNENNPTQRSSTNPQMQSARAFDERGRVILYHYEIYNENIKDLMASRGAITTRGYAGPLELKSTAERGTFVKNLQYDICRNATDAITAYWQAWTSRTNTSSELGPAKNFATYVMQLELFMMTDENPLPNRSVFSVIRLPGAEKSTSDEITRTRLRDSNLVRSISAFAKLTGDLARQPEPNRVINYGESKLTNLLEDVLGGNCKTRVICCLSPSNQRPEILSTILNGCGMLAQVKNYPIINDCLAQDLMTQYRTRGGSSVAHDHDASAGLLSKGELQDQLLKLTSDNTQLRERNDRLFQRLEQSQDKMTGVAKSKSELSAKLVASEEEKLRVSKGMIELQLQNNRLQEEFEAENFDLKNKILTLENQLVEFELEKNKFARNHDISAEHARQLEENRRKIAQDFVTLKTKAQDQEKELESQRKLNNEMRVELAKLIETEAALLDLRDNVEKRRIIHDEAGKELEEARKILRDANMPIMTARTAKATDGMEALEALRARRAEIHRQTLDRQRSILRSSRGGEMKIPEDAMTTEALARVRKVFDEQTRELENRLNELKSQLATAYTGIQISTKKQAEIITADEKIREEHKKFKEDNTRLQTELKEANEDYRRRLWKYVQDIADFVDNGGAKKSKTTTNNNIRSRNNGGNQGVVRDTMKQQVDDMFKEMKTAFQSREEQLTKAARDFKKQSKRVALKHENLLIYYRHQREQLELASEMHSSLPVFDIGPEPSELAVLNEPDVISRNQEELNKVRAQMEKAKLDLAARDHELLRRKTEKSSVSLRSGSADKINSDPLRKSSNQVLAEVERERADLLTRVNVAEQRAKEQQEYIDTHLAKYKQEIVRLRRIISEQGNGTELPPLSPDFKRQASFRY